MGKSLYLLLLLTAIPYFLLAQQTRDIIVLHENNQPIIGVNVYSFETEDYIAISDFDGKINLPQKSGKDNLFLIEYSGYSSLLIGKNQFSHSDTLILQSKDSDLMDNGGYLPFAVIETRSLFRKSENPKKYPNGILTKKEYSDDLFDSLAQNRYNRVDRFVNELNSDCNSTCEEKIILRFEVSPLGCIDNIEMFTKDFISLSNKKEIYKKLRCIGKSLMNMENDLGELIRKRTARGSRIHEGIVILI